MKRNNNKFRNNNGNNQIYSLNYKFDSTSPAGKVSGTALDLIKRYNELAKDAASDNDYISAEVFRQYAEHYRKIVTDINEKKNQNRQVFRSATEATENTFVENQNENTTGEVTETAEMQQSEPENAPEKKSFTVIEVPQTEAQAIGEPEMAEAETVRKKRVYRRRQQAVAE